MVESFQEHIELRAYGLGGRSVRQGLGLYSAV